MENIEELQYLLKEIAEKLYKHNLIGGYKLNEIDNLKISNVYSIACELLKLSLRNNLYRLVKHNFEKINEIAIGSLSIPVSLSELLFYKNEVLNHITNFGFPILIDNLFDSIAPINCLKLYVPLKYFDDIMLEFYSLNADIECNKENEHAKETAYFGDILTISIYPFLFDNKKNLVLKEKKSKEDKQVELRTIINGEVLDLCFEDYKNILKKETLEYSFMSAIDGDTKIDFIKAMYLKNDVNFKKLDKIESKILYEVEEEKKNGLQKIS